MINTELSCQSIGKCGMGGGDAADRVSPFRGGGEEFCASVGGVRSEHRKSFPHQQIRHPLHALSGDADLPGNIRDGQWLTKDGAEDLPPRARQACRGGQPLTEDEKLSIQTKDRLGDTAHQFLFVGHHKVGLDSKLSI